MIMKREKGELVAPVNGFTFWVMGKWNWQEQQEPIRRRLTGIFHTNYTHELLT